MIWGMGLLAVLAVAIWWLRGPQGWAWDRAFTSLLGYSTLIWASLLKIWWTAGKPSVMVDQEAIYYQPLHLFKPKRVAFSQILACSPKVQTHSLRLLEERRGVAREHSINLGVVQGRRRFLETLGKKLVEEGLQPIPGKLHSWARPGWDQPLVFGQRRARQVDEEGQS